MNAKLSTESTEMIIFMFKFKSEINEFEHLTFLKKIFKNIIILGYPSFNWPFSGPRIKNMDPQLPKWSFSRPHNNTVFLSFFCDLLLNLKSLFFYFIRSIYISICFLICN